MDRQRRRRGTRGLTIGVFTLGIGCGDSTTTEHDPLQVIAIEYADSLQTGGGNTIRIAASVGYDGCVVENPAVERRGDSLFVSGNARCQVTKHCLLAYFFLMTPLGGYELVNLPRPIFPMSLLLHAMYAGPATCDTTVTKESLRVRSYEGDSPPVAPAPVPSP